MGPLLRMENTCPLLAKGTRANGGCTRYLTDLQNTVNTEGIALQLLYDQFYIFDRFNPTS
jgi:hypothetical protein